MVIRPLQPDDLPHIKNIALALHPKWFDTNAMIHIPIDAQLGKSFVAEDQNTICGFIILSSLEGVVWINWMGVDPEYQGQLIGTNLLTYIENVLTKLGVKELRINTVVEQVPKDGTYDRTVQFYLKNGFAIVKKEEQQTFHEFVFRRGILLKRLG